MAHTRLSTASVLLLACLALPTRAAEAPMTLHRQAKDTLTAAEMNPGDTLEFTLRNGQTRRMTLEATSATVLQTNLAQLKKPKGGGATLYHFTARVRIDGHPMAMERYVGSQEAFYEPYVVNGMRLWFDAAACIFDFLTENHGECKPPKAARFAVHDAADPICPQEIRPWYPNDRGLIDMADCYNGDDCWLGAYQGADAHGGLDVNMPKGTPLWAPIDFDDQWYFNSLAMGHNNNRWRAVRKWPDGSLWTLQSHHMLRLLVPEHTPLKAGTHYAEAAGVLVGSHQHSHFVFKVAADGTEILLDPWIIFWQTFETARRKAGALRAAMAPLGPAATGKPVAFRSTGGKGACFWAFGDGGWAAGPSPTHAFLQPGIYPVTLVVEDGAARASCTQHLTVDAEPAAARGLVLRAPDEPSFRPRPVQAMDVYGVPPSRVPHTLDFLARPSRPVPRPRTVMVEAPGEATHRIEYQDGAGWLKLAGGAGKLEVSADATGLAPGRYAAVVSVESPGAANSPQGFRVVLDASADPPKQGVTVEVGDRGFECTPWFWVRNCAHGAAKGRGKPYLTNGARAAEGELARFTPDLAAGRYEVAFPAKTPYEVGVRFAVRVCCASGDETIWVEPAASRIVGAFPFEEGADGYVDILAAGSAGQVLLDAVMFRKVD